MRPILELFRPLIPETAIRYVLVGVANTWLGYGTLAFSLTSLPFVASPELMVFLLRPHRTRDRRDDRLRQDLVAAIV